MTDYFRLAGSWEAGPGVAAVSSGAPDIPAPIDERVLLAAKKFADYTLTSDAFKSVDFGTLSQVHVLIVKVPGEQVTLRITSAVGSQQLIPVEEFLALTALTTPLTAVDLQRVAGVTTKVGIFLGEKLG